MEVKEVGIYHQPNSQTTASAAGQCQERNTKSLRVKVGQKVFFFLNGCMSFHQRASANDITSVQMKAIKRLSKSPPSPMRSNKPCALVLSVCPFHSPHRPQCNHPPTPPSLIAAVQLILLFSSSPCHRGVPQGGWGAHAREEPLALRHIIRSRQSTLA